jgi:hypothetical protein
MRLLGIVYAAIAAIIITLATPLSTASASPILGGTGLAIRDAQPGLTTEVRGHRGFRGGRGWRGHRGFRGARFYGGPRYYRPYRPVRFGGPVYYGRPAYYGRRCFIRPARWVYTPYGYRLRPARRVCRF